MPAPTEAGEGQAAGFQELFHRRWRHLTDPHVRTLAWLLDAPDLLDPDAACWRGRVASLGPVDTGTAAWLAQLDRQPQALHAYLGLQPFTRLGRYAEKLLAFYLERQDMLFAHGVQVRTANATIGEFDFLIRHSEQLIHWEFATKLYLLEAGGQGAHADYFVGPNLADSLGAKVRKIMEQQLALSDHPAAQQQLPLPVSAAQALVKGWLFYHGRTPDRPEGVTAAHCRGFWRAQADTGLLRADAFVILARLEWLVPAISGPGAHLLADTTALRAQLLQRFAASSTPVLVALMRRCGDSWLEFDRGFIVPDDWRERAAARRGPSIQA